MVDKFSSTVRQTIMSAMSHQLQSDLCVAGTSDPLQHRPPLPKLDILAVDADEERTEEWVSRGDHWNKIFVGQGGVRVLHLSGGANMTQPSWLQVDPYQQWKCRSSTLPFASGVYGGAPQRGRTDLLGNTSVETLRVLLSVACQEDVFRVEDPFQISIADVSRAHSYAHAVHDVYVRLPGEDSKAKQPGVCGKLRKTMYGSVDAAQRWEEHYAHVG